MPKSPQDNPPESFVENIFKIAPSPKAMLFLLLAAMAVTSCRQGIKDLESDSSESEIAEVQKNDVEAQKQKIINSGQLYLNIFYGMENSVQGTITSGEGSRRAIQMNPDVYLDDFFISLYNLGELYKKADIVRARQILGKENITKEDLEALQSVGKFLQSKRFRNIFYGSSVQFSRVEAIYKFIEAMKRGDGVFSLDVGVLAEFNNLSRQNTAQDSVANVNFE